jgi:1,4-dihydroxy-2-naphthoyl-CoA hydrolase
VAIWQSDPMNFALESWERSLIAHLGIAAVEAGPDWLKARMPVDDRTRTAAGHLHGGAALALAETVAGWAASCCVEPTRHECIAVDIGATHLRVVADGVVFGIARPIELAERLQVWDVRIVSDRDVPVSVARVTFAVRDVPNWH